MKKLIIDLHSLPSESGFPEEQFVEVLDEWYGLPTEPYKHVTDTVRRETRSADLVMVLDSKMEGLTAELVATVADRSSTGLMYGGGGGLGLIIIGTKTTRYRVLRNNCFM